MDLFDLRDLLSETLGEPVISRHPEGREVLSFALADGAQLRIVEWGDGAVDIARPLSAEPSDAAMRAALEANCLGTATGAGALAIDPDDGALTMLRRIRPEAMDAGAAEIAMGEVIAHALYWEEAGLAAASAGAPPAGEMTFRP